MWKNVRLLCAPLVLAVASCTGGGNSAAIVPQGNTVAQKMGSGPRFSAVALPAGFTPRAIMRDGQIPGQMGSAPAIFSNGRITPLPTLPGADQSVVLWANSRGDAVGFSEFSARFPHTDAATLFSNGTARDLDPSGQAEIAQVIGEQGQIYGQSGSPGFLESPDLVRFTATGGAVKLSPINGVRAAGTFSDINSSGHFAGTELENSCCPVGDEAMSGSALSIALLPVNVFTSFATAIDNSGDVAGYEDLSNNTFEPSGTWTGFIRTKRRTTFLPFLPGAAQTQPTGLNDRGDIVGNSSGANGENATVFFYSHGAIYDVSARVTPSLTGLQALHGLSNENSFIVQAASGYYLITVTGGP